MTTPSTGATRASRAVILVAVDQTPASDDAVRTAALLAAIGEVELHLLHVIPPTMGAEVSGAYVVVPEPMIPEASAVEQRFLADVTARMSADFKGRIATHTTVGGPVREILVIAEEIDADVIVVGSHNRKGVERWLLGSVSEQIVRLASCSVIVARPKDYQGAVPEIEIEPPCPDCVATQKASGGARLWCERHAQRRVQAQLHYELPASYAVGSTFLRPEG